MILKTRLRDAADSLRHGAAGRGGRRPPGVVNVLTTTNPGGVTSAILADPRVRKLIVHRLVPVWVASCWPRRRNRSSAVRWSLAENAPFLVFDDADLDAALDGAMVAKMRNAGEACTAANRFYVQSGIHDAFVEGLTRRMAALKVGTGYDADTDCGPMITSGRGQEDRQAGVGRAGQRRARDDRRRTRSPETCSTTRRPLLENVPDRRTDRARGRSSAPLRRSTGYETEDEAVALANDTDIRACGLCLLARPQARAGGIGRRIEAGMIGLNRGIMSEPGRALRRRETERAGPGRRRSRHPRVSGGEILRRGILKVAGQGTCIGTGISSRISTRSWKRPRRAAASLPARHEMLRDIPYGDTPRQSFDIVLPPRPAEGAPIHMFVAWRLLARRDRRISIRSSPAQSLPQEGSRRSSATT